MSEESKLRIAAKLSDIKDDFVWHSLQFPELNNLGPRVGHSLISLKLGKVLMIGGGNHDGALQEVYTIDLEPTDNSERVKEHPAKQDFSPKYEFSCAKDKANNVWLFGGADAEKTSNCVVKLNEECVENVECGGEGPCERTQGSNSALVEYDGRTCIAIFAGGLKGEEPVNDRYLYLFDVIERKWETVKVKVDEELSSQLTFGCQPPSVQGHTMTAIGSKIFVHGGISNVTLYDGYHWLNLSKKNEDLSHSWIDSSVDPTDTKPSGRAAHGLAKVSDVDMTSSIIYMFGGLGKQGAMNDLWSVNIDSMSWTQVMKNRGEESYGYFPTPRLDFGMCSVGLQNNLGGKDQGASALSVYLIIHGGMNEKGELFNDAWVMKVR